MAKVFLGLGSNLNDRQKILITAINTISEKIGQVLKISPIYESEPLYYNQQPDFLNMAILVETEDPPFNLLQNLQNIENELGRVNKQKKNRARKIDIDILFYNGRIIKSENLKIPHPKLKERQFVLKPLMEIAPDFLYPGSGLSIKELYNQCPDNSKVQLIKDSRSIKNNLATL